jgi:predicted CopG family antitoxin
MSCKLRNIAISEDNYQKLKTLGKTGDRFNDVLSKVLSKTDVQQTSSAFGAILGNQMMHHD